MDYFMLGLVGASILSCVSIAGLMAYKGIEGWGWFLFVAVLLTSGFKIHVTG